MAYVQPNSRIEFFTDLCLSQDYNDTLYFPSISAKDAYFANIDRLAHVDKCYYARENRGFVRVELPMVTLIDAQYMRFKNTSYENKWWYAFVDDVNYVNDNTTEVKFTIDPMMTWMGEFHPKDCFIERQHGETDVIGDNLVDESFDCGEYVNLSAINENASPNLSRTGLFNSGLGNYQTPWKNNSGWVYMVFMQEPLLVSQPIRNALGIYNGLSVYIYPNTPDGLAAMAQATHLQDIFGDVISIILVPEAFIPVIPNYVTPLYPGAVNYATIPNRTEAPYVINFSEVTKNFTYIGGTGTTGGYQPKNKKLFTYPYNFLAVWNCEGGESIYRYELFSGDACEFQLCASYTQKPEIICLPRNYRKLGFNSQEGLVMRNFPMAGWSSDLFMAYIAQTLTTAPAGIMGASMLDGAIMQANATNLSQVAAKTDNSIITKGNASADAPGVNFKTSSDVRYNNIREEKPVGHAIPATNVARQITSLMVEGATHFTQPMLAHGQPSIDALTIMNEKDFYFYRRTIRPEYAQMIDNYFTMFGYAQKKIGTPNMNARQRFTYVKTVGCKIDCSCPASDIDAIEAIFNNGIRFWKDHTQIGNYHDDNLPNA